MKKRYLILIPVVTCLAIAAAAVGYHYSSANSSTKKFEDMGSGEITTISVNAPETRSQAKDILETMSLEQKIYQMMFVTPESLTGVAQVVQAGDASKAALEKAPVGGIIYFSKNLKDTDQTTQMLSNMQTYAAGAGAGIPLFLGVDEEGGEVARVANKLGTTKFEDMATYGAEGDTKKAYEIGSTIAGDISALGFNVDFAPVADVLTNENNTEIGTRSFGSDPQVVSGMVENEVKGLQENGVMAAMKHFPGHGSTEANSHDGESVTERTLDDMRACDLLPFEAGIEQDSAFVLISHMTATDISDKPCSMSSEVVTDLLRGELGFAGIAITDGLDMGAITDNYSNGDAAVQAIAAGNDMLLCPPSISEAYDAIAAAVEEGTLTEERINDSVLRILQIKLQYGMTVAAQ